MLIELHIKNIAVIDDVRAEFDGGLFALSGETGAGKSIIIDSMNLILGQTVKKDLIRTGEKSASVTAVFNVTDPQTLHELSELGIDIEEDNTLVIKRDITAGGKSVCRINGCTVSAGTLREAGKNLINIHGQHDNQSLLNSGKHIDLLDKYAGCDKQLEDYVNAFNEKCGIESRINKLRQSESERSQRISLIAFQAEELDDIKPLADEDTQISERIAFLSNAEKIAKNLGEAYELLYGSWDDGKGVTDLLSDAVNRLEAIGEYDARIEGYRDTLNSALIDISETTLDLKAFADDVEFDPMEFEAMQSRSNTLETLKRKYNMSIPEILEYRERIRGEAEELENSDELLEELNKDLQDCELRLRQAADALSKARKSAGRQLENKIMGELSDLDMKKTEFCVNITDKDYGINGRDEVEFLISANAGESLKPLSKIASGGEMSRIMLAIKAILADMESTDTLVFDEIDTGVSGRAAQRIAEKLYKISHNRLVICVTHLPQIASMADSHYYVEKEVVDNRVATRLTRLDEKSRIYELARITSGVSVTDLTLDNAREMLFMAKKMKEKFKKS